MKINWAFIDLDGTLLNSKKKITTENLNVLKNFTNNGGNIVITTGRWPVSALKLNSEIETYSSIKNKYLIAMNGSNIYDLNNDKLILENSIDEDIFNEILHHIKDLKIAAWIYTKKGIENKQIFSVRIPIKKIIEKFNYGKIIELQENKIIDDKVYKFLLFSLSKNEMDKIVKILTENYSEKLSIARLNKKSIEVTAANTSKGDAIKFIQKIEKFNFQKTVALGDSQNDITMFKTCRYKISFNSKDRMLTSLASVTYDNQKYFPEAFNNWIINYDPEKFDLDLKIKLDLYGWYENYNYQSINQYKNLMNYVIGNNSLTIESSLPNWLASSLFEPLLISKNSILKNKHIKPFTANQIDEAKKYFSNNIVDSLIIEYSDNEAILFTDNISCFKKYNLNFFNSIKPMQEFDYEKYINDKTISISLKDLNIIDFSLFKIAKSCMFHIYSNKDEKENKKTKNDNNFSIEEYKYLDEMFKKIDNFILEKNNNKQGENNGKNKEKENK